MNILNWLALEIYIDLTFICIDRFGRSSWSGVTSNAVVVEADAFKERDVIFRALSSRGHYDDMLQTAELVCFFVNTFFRNLAMTMDEI